ncbi:unnamed protein product [Clonostachys rosea]|uniref:Phenylalanine ammonia-lyase n=1 Tax=Bionectria ochroleuca TaxID=29856 RepID=A0ABY6V0H4_BIOOC|nr:unnamed protein product [Clonostachys rosea]
MTRHLAQQLEVWAAVNTLVAADEEVQVDGQSLSVAELIAISRHKLPFAPSRKRSVTEKVEDSVRTLSTYMEDHVVYGVNTAPGGNAHLRTTDVKILQHSFLQHHHTGILPETIPLANNENPWSDSLPDAVVRASAVVRCNSLLRGHSGIRLHLVEALAHVISRGLTPVIPLRGSISASGDLSPLSYFGGVLEGNKAIFVRTASSAEPAHAIPADEALRQIDLQPILLEQKEGLAIMNGTSVSTAYAALVLQDCHDLAILCQLMTALAVEALNGKVSNYDQFLSDARPHPGQHEVAYNIRQFLAGTKLASDGAGIQGLAQDRYALRTAPQWIGPQLEDLMSAQAQISVELNSTTDNPLIDSTTHRLHHGGNFQAASVTSAMEKARTAVTMLGRLLLAQSGELVNPELSHGLPPNLCADDPSVSYTCKGLDVNMTAYFSELAFMANSVASHVQTAEMGNQSVNSLALVSTRMTAESVKLLTMMAAAHLYMLCQAVDLRCREQQLFEQLSSLVRLEFEAVFSQTLTSPELDSIYSETWPMIKTSWLEQNKLDIHQRCEKVSNNCVVTLMAQLQGLSGRSRVTLEQISEFKERLSLCLRVGFDSTRHEFALSQTTLSYLGSHTRSLYSFVRSQLKIPFHNGIGDHPTLLAKEEQPASTIGYHVTRIFGAIRDKSVFESLNLSNVLSTNGTNGRHD